jgi:hypothetical protein
MGLPVVGFHSRTVLPRWPGAGSRTGRSALPRDREQAGPVLCAVPKLSLRLAKRV